MKLHVCDLCEWHSDQSHAKGCTNYNCRHGTDCNEKTTSEFFKPNQFYAQHEQDLLKLAKSLT